MNEIGPFPIMKSRILYLGSQVVADYGTYPQTNVYETLTESKTSINDDKFVRGEFLIHPYSVSRTTLIGGDGSAELNYPIGPYIRKDTYWGKIGLLSATPLVTNFPSLQDFPSESGRALQKAYSKVGQSDLQLGVELGELRETLAMLRSPLKSLRNFFLNDPNKKALGLLEQFIRGRRSGRIALSAKTLADTWLEIRYGLRPLVSSILAIQKEADKKQKRFFSRTIRSSGAMISARQETSTTYKAGGFYGFYPCANNVKRMDAKIRARVYYRRWYEATIAQKLGLSVEYTPEIVWELTRLSFVVDWIFSIGPWIGSHRFKPGIEILGNTVSMKAETTGYSNTTEIHVDQSRSGNNMLEAVDVEPVTYEDHRYERICDVDLSSTPFFRYADAVSLFHTVDALALILQPLLKKLR